MRSICVYLGSSPGAAPVYGAAAAALGRHLGSRVAWRPRPGGFGEVLGARGSASEAGHEEAYGHGSEKGSDDGGGAQEGEHVAGGARGQANNNDFHRLLALQFRHLISAHGEPLRDEAHPRVAAAVAAVFSGC